VRRLKAPEVVIRRLALYLRILQQIEDQEGSPYLSSKELGERAGVNSAQVRKDLALFGEFGKQGVGYEIAFLRQELKSILNVDRTLNVGLVGVGELGTALLRYIFRRFDGDPHYPFRLVAGFDADDSKIGREFEDGVLIHHVDEIGEKVKELDIKMFVITVPANAAQGVVDDCVEAGIKGILNFAPTKIFVPPHVRLHHSDVSLELQQLAYYLYES